MILIFEGCDKAGKSTLIDNFKKNTLIDWSTINYTYPTVSPKAAFGIGGQKPTDREMMIEQLSSYTTSFKIFRKFNLHHNIICDRFWVGEFVYCKIRNYSYPEMAERKWLKFFLNSTYEIGAVLIYVKADLLTIQQRMTKDTEKDYISVDEVKLITSEYERIFSILKDLDKYEPSRIIEIDTAGYTKRESLDRLISEMAQRKFWR